MSSIINEKKDSHNPMKIAEKIRQQDSIVVSPIDLSLEKTEPLSTGQLQWINFYEPPLQMGLRNVGDTVKIEGRWGRQNQRPLICGGPLDGRYIFSHIHFHWDSPFHQHNRHTICGKSNSLEMHALFYKSSYKNQAEAQEKEDGVLMVVYFFKLEEQSSFKWMTDHLQRVTVRRAVAQLPPAPLSALLVPFSQDYLVYWGALPCTCHHVLWMVSRTAMRITHEELEEFCKLQSDPREKINRSGLNTGKCAEHVYHINPSIGNREVIFTDALDPPCQIITGPKTITIAIAYRPAKVEKVISDSASFGGTHSSKTLSFQNRTFKDKSTSTSNSGFKIESPSYTSVRHMCSVCSNPTSHAECRLLYKTPWKKRSMPLKTNVVGKGGITIAVKSQTTDVGKSKGRARRKYFKLRRKEIRAAMKMMEKQRKTMYAMKQALEEEMKKYVAAQKIKEIAMKDKEIVQANNDAIRPQSMNVKNMPPSKRKSTKKFAPKQKIKEIAIKDEEFVEANNDPKRPQSTNVKNVLASKRKSVPEDKNNLQEEKEIEEENKKSISHQHDDLPANSESENSRDQSLVKEQQEKKGKKYQTRKPKLPLQFTPYRPEGLQSSLKQYFESHKHEILRPFAKKSENSRRNNVNKSAIALKNTTINKIENELQDFGGKGDHSVHNQKKPMVNLVANGKER